MFKRGQEVWCVPIRFWEPEEHVPMPIVVKMHTSDDFVFGYFFEYGHDAYVEAARCHASYDEARRAQLAMGEEKRQRADADHKRWWEENSAKIMTLLHVRRP